MFRQLASTRRKPSGELPSRIRRSGSGAGRERKGAVLRTCAIRVSGEINESHALRDWISSEADTLLVWRCVALGIGAAQKSLHCGGARGGQRSQALVSPRVLVGALREQQ